MNLDCFHCQSLKKTFADGNDIEIEERSAASTNALSTLRSKLVDVMIAAESACPRNRGGRATRRLGPYLHYKVKIGCTARTTNFRSYFIQVLGIPDFDFAIPRCLFLDVMLESVARNMPVSMTTSGIHL